MFPSLSTAVAKGNSHAALAYNGKGPPIDGRRHIEYVKMGDECCFKGMGGGIMIGDTALCRLGIEEEPDEHADEGGQSKPSQPFLRYDECVFRLVPMLSYRARQELEVKKKELRTRELKRVQQERSHADAPDVDSDDDEGMLELSNDSLANDRQLLKELHRSEANEHEQNLRSPTERCGKIVNYGDVVQLLHVHSGRYIQLLEKTASLDKDCLALALGKGSDSCYFQIRPRFKSRSWGSPVYYDDEVTIVSHQMNMNLHGSRSKFYSSPMSTVASNDVVESTDGLGSPLPFSLQSPRQREVNGSRDFYSFQITFYQRDNGTDSELRTQAGFRLFHPEADSFMQASGSACKNGMRVDGKTWAHVPYLKSIDGMAAVPTIVEGRVDPNLNIKGLWSCENVHRRRGGTVPFDAPMRIRHIPSRKYLACQTSSSSSTHADCFECALVNDVDPSVAPGAFGSAQSLVFYIVPEDIVGAWSIPCSMSTMVRLEHRHSVDGSRLYFHHTGHTKAPLRTPPSAGEDRRGLSSTRGTGIVFSRQQQAQDMLKLIPSSMEETVLVNGIVAKRYLLDAYRWQMENAKTVPDDLVESCIAILLRLMDDVTKGDGFGSGLASIMKKPISELINLANATLPTKFSSLFMGAPDAPFQDKIIDCKIMDIVFAMSLAPYNRFLRMDEKGQLLSSVPGIRSANPWTDASGSLRETMTRPRALHKVCHVALQLFFNGNFRAQNYFSRRVIFFLQLETETADGGGTAACSSMVKKNESTPWLHVITGQSEDPLGSTVTLSKLFTDNEEIISSVVNVPLLQKFCQLIIRCGPQPRFLRLFESICSCHGKPIIANQEMVLRQIWMDEEARRKILIDVFTVEGAYFADDDGSPIHNVPNGIPEDLKCLAAEETNMGREMPAVYVSWSGIPDWKSDCDALFWDADVLELNAATAFKVEQRSGVRPARTKPGAVLLESLMWILDPEALCEKVTGRRWGEMNPYATETESTRIWEDAGLGGKGSRKSVSDVEKKATIERFKRQEQLADWFVAQLYLIRKLVFGRSYNNIRHIEKVYTYPLLLSMAWNERLPCALRSCSLDLLASLHLDRFPQLKHAGKPSLPEHLWVYESEYTDQGGSGVAKVRERAIIEKDALPGFLLDENHPFAALTDDKAKSFATDTKFYLLRILANHNISTIGERLAHSNRAMNEFALSNLELSNQLLGFGFQSNIHKLRDLGTSITKLLDGRSDEETPNRPFFPPENRYKDDAGNFMRVAQLKTTAIDILMNISDLRASYRLATVLWYWRDRYLSSAAQKNGGSNQILPTMDGKAGEARLPLGTAADEDNVSSPDNVDDENHLDQLEEEIFMDFESLFEHNPLGDRDESDAVELDLARLTGQPIVEILVDCLMYENDGLFEKAFALLDRRFGQRRKLVGAISEVYLLDTPELEVFGTANNLLAKCGYLLYTYRSTNDWAVQSRLSGDFDGARFDFLKETCQNLLDFLSCPSPDERVHRQAILNAANLPATLAEGMRLDINLSFRGSVCSDNDRLNSQHMFLVSVEYLARVLGAFVRNNPDNQEKMFPFLNSLCRLIDATPHVCSPPEVHQELHRRNREAYNAGRSACKQAILDVLKGNANHCLKLASYASEFQRVFDIFATDLNVAVRDGVDIKDSPDITFFLRVAKPSNDAHALPRMQHELMKVLLRGRTAELRSAMKSCLTFWESGILSPELLLKIVAVLVQGNLTTSNKLTELFYGDHADASSTDASSTGPAHINLKTMISFLSRALEYFLSKKVSSPVAPSPKKEADDDDDDDDLGSNWVASLPAALAELADVTAVVSQCLHIDPDMLVHEPFWKFSDSFCTYFEQYVAQPKGGAKTKANAVIKEVVNQGLTVFVNCLKSAASNSLLEAIFESRGASLRRLLSTSRHFVHESVKVDSVVMKAKELLISCGDTIKESAREVMSRRRTNSVHGGSTSQLKRRSSVSLTTHGASLSLRNRRMASKLEVFKKCIQKNPRIQHKIKLRRFDLSNCMEKGLGQPEIVALENTKHKTEVVLYDWLESPFPSFCIMALVVIGGVLAFCEMFGVPIGDIEAFEIIVSIIFIIELGIRSNGFVHKFAFGDYRALYKKCIPKNSKSEAIVWPYISDPINCIDIVVVILDILIRIIMAASESNSKLGADLIAFLRIVRLARFAKFLRYALRAANVTCMKFVDPGANRNTKKQKIDLMQAKISWDDLIARMVTYGMANYFKPEKKDSMCRIFDVLYFSLLKHRTVDHEVLTVQELQFVPPARHGYRTQREIYEKYQATMENNRVSKLIFSTIAHSPATWDTDSAVHAAFRLSMEKLQGGNLHVQRGLAKCIVDEDPDGKFHQHFEAKMFMTRELVVAWRHEGDDDYLEEYQEKLQLSCDTFTYLTQSVEGHNSEFQRLLSEQSTHVGNIDLLHNTVLLLLVLCESTEAVATMIDEELDLTLAVFDFLAEACYGPCERNQSAIATKLDAVIAIRNVLKLEVDYENAQKVTKHDKGEKDAKRDRVLTVATARKMIKLKVSAVQLIFACFEGRAQDNDVVPVLKGKIEPSLLWQFEKQLERIAKKNLKLIEGRGRGASDEGPRLLYFEAVDGMCKIRTIMDMFDRVHGTHEDRLAVKLSRKPLTSFTHVKDFEDVDNDLVGTVEIFWRGRTIETYFPLPIERNLSSESREAFLETVDVAVGRRMRDLVSKREQIMRDMELDAEFFGRFPFFGWVHKHEMMFRTFMYMLTMLLNYNVLLNSRHVRNLVYKAFLEDPCDGTKRGFMCIVDEGGSAAPFLMTWIAALSAFIGYFIIFIIHTATAARSVISRVNSAIKKEALGISAGRQVAPASLFFGPALLFVFSIAIVVIQYASIGSEYVPVTCWTLGTIMGIWLLKAMRDSFAVPWDTKTWLFLVTYDVIVRGRFVGGHLILQGFMAMGFIDVYFFTPILFDVFSFNRELQDIVHGITGPGRSLLLVAFTVVITLIVFAAVASSSFRKYFDHEDGEGGGADDEVFGDGGIEYGGAGCNSPISCFYYLLYFGLPENGNLAPILEGANYEDSNDLYGRMIYDLFFFIWVGVLLFNIITGLILDAFSSQRQRSENRNEIFKNECFVCGITRTQFKDMNLPAGDDSFEQHAFVEHSLWNYIFYIHVLMKKDKTDYTGLDTYVKSCLDTGQLSWVPSQTSHAIESHGRNGEDENAKWTDQIAALQTSVSSRLEEFSSVMKGMQQELTANGKLRTDMTIAESEPGEDSD